MHAREHVVTGRERALELDDAPVQGLALEDVRLALVVLGRARYVRPRAHRVESCVHVADRGLELRHERRVLRKPTLRAGEGARPGTCTITGAARSTGSAGRGS